jgi:two-component system, chemotaxis family, response regulator Rcp1
MLKLDLCNLSEIELEEHVSSCCAEFGTVTNVSVHAPVGGDGNPFALVSMSTFAEMEHVLAEFGDSKFGASAIIHLVQSADIRPGEGRKGAVILLVEDNPADVRMTREALRAADAPHQLHVVEDGIDAIAFLYQEGKFADAPRPDLILLDLNLPRMNGHEVLLEIKSSDRFCRIPVIVLTSSRAESDIDRSYELDADRFLTKPAGLDAFKQEITLIESLLPH